MAISIQRKQFLLSSLLTKLMARGTKPTLRICLERAFGKFDRDHSGALDMEEFRLAMEEHLPGIDENEVQALAREFDADGNGSLSISEFVGTLTGLATATSTGCDVPVGAHSQGVLQKSARRRPIAGGIQQRQAPEFVDDGYNHCNALDSSDFDPLVLKLRRGLEALAAQFNASGAEMRLLRRALQRQKATPAAGHLTLHQFATALAPFLGGSMDHELLERLWKKCNSGDCDAFMVLYAQRANQPTAQEACSHQRERPLSKQGLAALRLKHMLLDKIDDRAGVGTFRMRVKRLVDKYDKENSGFLNRSECLQAFVDLLPGVPQEHIERLLDDFDTDSDGSLSVEELVAGLLKSHQSRVPSSTSINLSRKQPLWTKAGARGLT